MFSTRVARIFFSYQDYSLLHPRFITQKIFICNENDSTNSSFLSRTWQKNLALRNCRVKRYFLNQNAFICHQKTTAVLEQQVVPVDTLNSVLGYLEDEHVKQALLSEVLRLRRTSLRRAGFVNVPIKAGHGVRYIFSFQRIVYQLQIHILGLLFRDTLLLLLHRSIFSHEVFYEYM